MPRRTPAVVAVVAPLALAALLALPAAPAALGASSPAFRLVDAGVTGSELNLGWDAKGALFVGGWDAIARSFDGGATWDKVQTLPFLSVAADRVLVVDKATGRVFVDDTTLGCTILSWSDDQGASWLANPAACGGGVTDHEKVAVGARTALADPTGLLYKDIVYVCANGLALTDCGVSALGGLAFTPAAPHGIGCAFQGAPVADARGVLYEPTSACGAMVRSTADNGLSWVERAVGPAKTSSDTPDLGVTADGALYFFYTDAQWRPAFVRSADGGRTWAGPFAVPVPGLVSSVFPSVVGGDAGRIALSFYATTDDAGGWNHNPGDAPDAIRWNGYVAVVTDADAAVPTVQPVQLTDDTDPLQYGCLSKLGSCLDNIADYMDVDAAADGRVAAVFVDGCPPGCHDHGSSTKSEALVAAQVAGAGLRA